MNSDYRWFSPDGLSCHDIEAFLEQPHRVVEPCGEAA